MKVVIITLCGVIALTVEGILTWCLASSPEVNSRAAWTIGYIGFVAIFVLIAAGMDRSK